MSVESIREGIKSCEKNRKQQDDYHDQRIKEFRADHNIKAVKKEQENKKVKHDYWTNEINRLKIELDRQKASSNSRSSSKSSSSRKSSSSKSSSVDMTSALLGAGLSSLLSPREMTPEEKRKQKIVLGISLKVLLVVFILSMMIGFISMGIEKARVKHEEQFTNYIMTGNPAEASKIVKRNESYMLDSEHLCKIAEVLTYADEKATSKFASEVRKYAVKSSSTDEIAYTICNVGLYDVAIDALVFEDKKYGELSLSHAFAGMLRAAVIDNNASMAVEANNIDKLDELTALAIEKCPNSYHIAIAEPIMYYLSKKNQKGLAKYFETLPSEESLFSGLYPVLSKEQYKQLLSYRKNSIIKAFGSDTYKSLVALAN